MASDPTKPLLRLESQPQTDRPIGQPRVIPRPQPFPQADQTAKFGPKFNRLAQLLDKDASGIELRGDPSGMAPERLLVFEVRGSIATFAAAIRNVPGLELVDEEELSGDAIDSAPVAYLMVPDIRALRDLEGFWQRWQRGELVRGETAWRDVFGMLRDLRPWGPSDRVQLDDIGGLAEEIDGRGADEMVFIEIELIFRGTERVAAEQEQEVTTAIVARGGRVVSRARIESIAYHALLVELSVRYVIEIIERSPEGIAGLDAVMHIRPQSAVTELRVEDFSDSDPTARRPQLGSPILALLDGVPVAAHNLLAEHVVVDDQFQLEQSTPVAERLHGTAMASLIIHGDRNRPEAPLPRQIHVVPVLGSKDLFPPNRLIIDLIYSAVVRMRDGRQATATDVILVNVSLGNRRRPFHGQMSPWARLLDRLAYQYGILFLVSAGNHVQPFPVAAFANRMNFEDAEAEDRSAGVMRALGGVVADRRLLAPAETLNGVTVGASNDDYVSVAHRAGARANIDPFPNLRNANPSSALGPGFALSVKPDILMPGAREHLRVVSSGLKIEVEPGAANRSAGLKVAAPPLQGRENIDGFTNGSSAATALASRTAHRIHDALEGAYGDLFTQMSRQERAVLLKALLVHPAKWPNDAVSLIRNTIGPSEGKYHSRQKDNIRRFLGFGFVDGDDAVACLDDRATFWASGSLDGDKIATISMPIPMSIGGQPRPHSVSATLAWFTPVSPGRKSYRSVRLKVLEPMGSDNLRVKAVSNQPDGNQTNRGTLFMRTWSGTKAPIVNANGTMDFIVQRDPDQGGVIDDRIPFALAITLTMPGIIQIYEEARARVPVQPRQQVLA